eukprot:COSAG02_NODE_67843_length_252_cov_0.647059_1_plen_44_part_01
MIEYKYQRTDDLNLKYICTQLSHSAVHGASEDPQDAIQQDAAGA